MFRCFCSFYSFYGLDSILPLILCFLRAPTMPARGHRSPWDKAPFHTVLSLVAQSCPTLRPRGLQNTRLPCPSSAPRACSNSCPSSQWCHPTILSSIVPFSCFRSFPASGSFPVSQCFTSGGQSIGVSASTSVLPKNIQLVGSPCSPRDSQESLL